MALKFPFISIVTFVALLMFGSCEKERSQPRRAQSGLFANMVYERDFYADTSLQLRMFTKEGEVLDHDVIYEYALRSYYNYLPSDALTKRPEEILSTNTDTVWFNSQKPYTATSDGTLIFQQLDTAEYKANSLANIDSVYFQELQFVGLSDGLLEKNGSHEKFERIDTYSYQAFARLRITGTYVHGNFRNDVLVLPYTFIACRRQFKTYPFAVKSSPSVQLSAGDTLLIRQLYETYRVK